MADINEINTCTDTEKNCETQRELLPGVFSGAVLKWIALITMVIDHIAAAIGVNTSSSAVLMSYSWGGNTYFLMRFIGRIAFPLFAFLLVEGFVHTNSRTRQLKRLIIFGVISQVPYYFCLNSPSNWDFNILLTLAYCYLALMFFEWAVFRLGIDLGPIRHPIVSSLFILFQYLLVFIFTLLIFGIGSVIFKLDYDWGAVLMVLLFYVFRKDRLLAASLGIGALIMFMISTGSFSYTGTLIVSWMAMMLYNGKRGRQNKWFFYIFYPAHLSAILFLRYLIFA